MACVYLSFSNGLEISQMSSNMTRSQKYFVVFEFSKIMQDLKQLGFGCLYLFFYSDSDINNDYILKSRFRNMPNYC